jgi:hypothetical protein
VPPDNGEDGKSLKDLPNRKSKGRRVTSIRVDGDLHEAFVEECRRAGVRSCDVLEICEKIFIAIRRLKLDQILEEDERSDRAERKREIFTYALFTQTLNRDKRRLKNVIQGHGNLMEGCSTSGGKARVRRFYCALKDVWVEPDDLPTVYCRGCPNRACGAYVFSRAA